MTTATRNERTYQPTEGIGRRLERLRSLEIQRAVIEAEIAGETGYLLVHCQRYNLDVLRLAGDRLTASATAGRSTWKFTRATDALLRQAKAAQEAEKASGKAKKIPGKPYLSVRVGKGAAVAPEQAPDLATFGQAVAEAAAQQPAAV